MFQQINKKHASGVPFSGHLALRNVMQLQPSKNRTEIAENIASGITPVSTPDFAALERSWRPRKRQGPSSGSGAEQNERNYSAVAGKSPLPHVSNRRQADNKEKAPGERRVVLAPRARGPGWFRVDHDGLIILGNIWI